MDQVSYHVHNGTDAPQINLADTQGSLPVARGGTGVDTLIEVRELVGILKSATAGETLTAGEAAKLYTAGASNADKGFGHTAGAVYAVRAAGNDTTYGDHVLGIVEQSADYLDTVYIRLMGEGEVFSGLTVNTEYYLKNHSAAASETITQSTQNTEQKLSAGVTIQQTFIPTSSKLAKITLRMKRNGGLGDGAILKLFRQNTELGSATANPDNTNTFSEFDFDISDVRVYKGELLRFTVAGVDGVETDVYVSYQSTGSPYSATYAPDGTTGQASGGSIPATGADLYFKVFEFTEFGQMATSAGTRKFKMGRSTEAATNFVVSIQEADAIL